jgi:hypothetical protein
MTDHTERAENKPFHFLGVWGEAWQVRATLARNAERYFALLRQRGCSRDEAAALVVQSLVEMPCSEETISAIDACKKEERTDDGEHSRAR